MATQALLLKYLFGAHFADGHEVFQTPEDVSETDPRRSAFFDLCEHTPEGDLVIEGDGKLAKTRPDIELFQLQGEDFNYLVDLRDGHFEIAFSDGKRKRPSAWFYVQIPPPGAKLRLLYFRRRRQHANANILFVQEGDKAVPQIQSLEDAGQECEYHFGWTTEDGLHKAELILG